jgi:CheY-like chemotaxis protein
MSANIFDHQPISSPPLLTISILVIDDDCDDSSFIKDTIEELFPKYEVHCMDKGEKALRHLDTLSPERLPNLIIVDYNMPIITGIDIVKSVKSNDAYKHIPIAVYSHSSFPMHETECLKAGASLYLTKTSSIHSLKRDVKQMLSLIA